MTRDEIVAHQQREREFAATDLGKAFIRFERRAADAWVKDTQGYERSADRAWAAHAEARSELMKLLRPAAGLAP